jgi:hypothetical protein
MLTPIFSPALVVFLLAARSHSLATTTTLVLGRSFWLRLLIIIVVFK